MDSWETLRNHLSNISRVVEYCENAIDCRRQQVLQYFGEEFDPDQCGRTCDNCARSGTVEERNVADHVRGLVALMRELGP